MMFGKVITSKKIKLLVMLWALLASVRFSLARAEEAEVPAFELEKIVVTATKTEVPIEQIGSSVSVITKEDIKKQGAKTVLEVLRDVPGVSVVRSGSFGGNTSMFLRGANSEHTLVMIDGIEMNDPMSATRSFDFAHLTTDNVERIEVIRGPQSTLYGSDAIGGVINIVTKKGVGRLKSNISSEVGSYETFHESMNVSGATEEINYSLSASRVDSGGISKAADGSEDDSYQNTTLSSRLGFSVFGSSELSFILNFIDTRTDIDDGSYDDDPNYIAKTETSAFKTQYNQPLTSWWEHRLTLSLLDFEREYKDPPDDIDPTDSYYDWYDGENKKVEWQHNFFIIKQNDTVTAGFEYEEEKGKSKTFSTETAITKGYYFQNQLPLWESLFATVGIRIDDHEKFGSDINYKTTCAYLIKQTGTKLKGNWGTGFKAPSLFQLYSSYGDPNLSPEEVESYDLGFEQKLMKDKILVSLTYFHNDFDQLIEYDLATWKYKNVGKAKTEGVEVELSIQPIEDLRIVAGYTYTDTKNKVTGKELARRPKNKCNLNINHRFWEKTNVNLKVSYFGSRWNDLNITRKMEDYTRIDLAGSYDLTKDFQIFGRVENLFDRDYQEVYGYETPGISFYAGIGAKF